MFRINIILLSVGVDADIVINSIVLGVNGSLIFDLVT